MRTRTWLLALSATAGLAALPSACTINDGGSGGNNTSSNSSTGATTTVSSTTSSTTAGSGGHGADNCPGGNAINLNVDNNALDNQVTLQGSTSNEADNLNEFCAKGGPTTAAPDVVYQIHTTQECTFTAALTEQGFDGVLSLRSTCSARTGDSLCYDSQTSGETIKVDLPAGDHWLVVDGATAGAKGDFKLTLDCADPSCGDGVIGAEEQCDLGMNPPVSSGCGGPNSGASACQFITTTAADTCPGTGISVTPGTQLLPSPPPPYNNFQAHDDYNPTPAPTTCPFVAAVPANGDSAPDQVFDLVPTVNGTMTVTIGLAADGVTNACDIANNPGCWNTGMFIRQGDCTAGSQIACNVEGNNNTGVYNVSVPGAVAGTHYYLFVKTPDALASDAFLATGPYYLQIALTQ